MWRRREGAISFSSDAEPQALKTTAYVQKWRASSALLLLFCWLTKAMQRKKSQRSRAYIVFTTCFQRFRLGAFRNAQKFVFQSNDWQNTEDTVFAESIWRVVLYFPNKHLLASLNKRQWTRKCNSSSATPRSHKDPRCPLGAGVPDPTCSSPRPPLSCFYLGIISRLWLPLNVFPSLCSSAVFILISMLKSIERKWLISQPETHCFHARFSFCFCLFFSLRSRAAVFGVKSSSKV